MNRASVSAKKAKPIDLYTEIEGLGVSLYDVRVLAALAPPQAGSKAEILEAAILHAVMELDVLAKAMGESEHELVLRQISKRLSNATVYAGIAGKIHKVAEAEKGRAR